MTLAGAIAIYAVGTSEGAKKGWDTRGRTAGKLEEKLSKQGFKKLPFDATHVGYAFAIPAHSSVDLGKGPALSEMGLRIVYDPEQNSFGVGPAAHLDIKHALSPQAPAFFDMTPRGSIYQGGTETGPYLVMDAPRSLFEGVDVETNLGNRRVYNAMERNYGMAMANMPRFTLNGQRVKVFAPGWGRPDATKYQRAVEKVREYAEAR